MAQQTSDEALKKATGKVWAEWFTILDKAGAKDMPHPQIARHLHDNKLITSGWWCQQVTVGYEQHIGRRKIGQRGDGAYEVSVTKTLTGYDLDTALQRWQELVAGKKTFNKKQVVSEPSVKATEKWRYWRASFTDKTKITVHISKITDNKVQVAVQHEKISSADARDEWRNFWKKLFKDL